MWLEIVRLVECCSVNDRQEDRIHSAERSDAQLHYLFLHVLIHFLVWCQGSVHLVLEFRTTSHEIVILKDMIN